LGGANRLLFTGVTWHDLAREKIFISPYQDISNIVNDKYTSKKTVISRLITKKLPVKPAIIIFLPSLQIASL
jgi:hypothetical protein